MYVASASTTVKFHEFPSGNTIHNYQPGTKVKGPIRSISWSRDGYWLILIPHSGVAEIISVKDNLRLLKTILDIDEPTCATFQNTTKKNVAIGTTTGLVLIYDIKSRSTKKRFPKSSSHITHLQFTAKDGHCVAGCKNGDVLLYNNITNSPPSTLRVPKSNSLNCLCTNKQKRNLILGGSNEGVVAVWDTNVGKSKFHLSAHEAPVNAVTFSPVNSDLIVSTGSDRRCCFYDIVDNKCIASVSVENSITSVDFSPNGTYFVMGSQNGRIYIYDSRNIQEPIQSFAAHSTAVKHLAFQHLQDVAAKNTSTCSISSESLTPIPSFEELPKRNSDMFGMFVPSVDAPDEVRKSVVSMEGGDSFIAALGLDKNSTAGSLKHDDSAFSRCTNRPPSISADPPPPTITTAVGDTAGEPRDFKLKQFTSTPKLLSQNYQLEASPIVADKNMSVTLSSDLRAIVKESLQEEMKTLLDSIKHEIKFNCAETNRQLRLMMLDMQMCMIREFIKIENNYNHQSKEVSSTVTSTSKNKNLLAENERLRKRIEFLEAQLTNVVASKDSKSNTYLK